MSTTPRVAALAGYEAIAVALLHHDHHLLTGTERLNPAYYEDPAAFANAGLGFVLDPWQREVMSSHSSRILLNCSRQAGKTSVMAALAAYHAIYQPHSLVLIVSPSERQSQEVNRVCLDIYHRLGWAPDTIAESRLALELTNGSRILALPASEATLRGFAAVRLLIFDEAAHMPDGLYKVMRPMLAVSQGRIIAASTPYGQRGWWWHAWAGPDEDEAWERYAIDALQCPRISAEFLAEERRAQGEWWFRQEYMCEAMQGQTQAFNPADVDRIFVRSSAPGWEWLSQR